MTAPAFVTVDTAGRPCAHETAAGAIETHLRDIGGAWNLYGDRRPQIESDLAKHGESRFDYVSPDFSPRFAAVFDNRGNPGAPLERFRNAHLWGRPNSVAYVQQAATAWSNRPGPRVGDFVLHPDGKKTRFTYDWGDGLQAGRGPGSYHISRDGFASYSGGLSAPIPRDRLTDTGETQPGEFWFFLDGWTGAHRGVSISIPCRVFREADALGGRTRAELVGNKRGDS